MLNEKNKSILSSEPVDGSPNLFIINPTNSQRVMIKGSTPTYQNDTTYNLNDPDLQFFKTNTQFDGELQNVGLI